MLPDRVSNPGPLTSSQVPYRLHYSARGGGGGGGGGGCMVEFFEMLSFGAQGCGFKSLVDQLETEKLLLTQQ